MIKASYHITEEEAYLLITGHADYSDGEDIVCAGVSSLAMALNRFIEERDFETIHIEGREGSSIFIVKDKNKINMAKAMTAFEVVVSGIEVLSIDYPHNVSIERLSRIPRGAL